MRIERIPLSEMAAYVPPMAQAYAAFERLASRYAVDHRDERELVEAARRAASRGAEEAALSTAERRLASLGAPAAVFASVEKLRRGAAAVVTGQQPGVAWGPVYNLYKAIGAIRLARAIESRGVPCVPVFWNHSDDHHAAELGRIRMPDAAELTVDLGDDDRVLYSRPLDGRALADRLKGSLPDTPHREGVLALIASCGATLAEAYSRLMLALFGRHGLIVVEPRDLDGPRSAAVLRRALAEPDLVERAVAEGGRALAALGFKPPLAGPFGTNVYSIGDDGRRVRTSEAKGRLSAGVALRLIVQDSVLPTAAYVGGPNESAYVGQLTELYAAYALPMPAVVPRISATLVEPRVARVAHKFGFERADLLRPAGELEARVASRTSQSLLEEIARTGDDVAARLKAMEPELGRIEAPLVDAARKTSEKARLALEAFARRVIEAKRQADETARTQIAKLVNHVTPRGGLQERVYTPAYYLAMFGPTLFDELLEALDARTAEHQLVWL